jgi:hypothetical protein
MEIHLNAFSTGLCNRNAKVRERGVKMVRNVKRLKVNPETTEPEFEKVPSRSLLIMARLGEWNDFLLSARCNVSTVDATCLPASGGALTGHDFA